MSSCWSEFSGASAPGRADVSGPLSVSGGSRPFLCQKSVVVDAFCLFLKLNDFCLFLKLKLLSISGDCYCGVVLTQNWFEMHTHRISGFLFCCPFCLSIPVSELDLKAQN